MKLSDHFSKPLEELVRKMGAAQSDWTPGGGQLNPLEVLRRELEEGCTVELSDVENLGGLLSYKGQQILLYIMNTGHSRYTLENEPEKSKRFHITECSTIEDMREKGRFDRYVATTNTTGRFRVEWRDYSTRAQGETEANLLVCKNCLKYLDWNNYSRARNKNTIWHGFDLDDFFREYSTFFSSRPKYTDKTVPIGGYVQEWNSISRNYRQSVGWKCEDCGVDLSGHKNLLHTHHINGVVGDNADSNFRALCVECHSKQPHHSHMHTSDQDHRTIAQLRLHSKKHAA